MSAITTHVLDTSLGKPASGVKVTLSVSDPGGFRELATAETDADGRVRQFVPGAPLEQSSYRLVFETAAHFRKSARPAFFERVTLDFVVSDPSAHYHVPLLLTPFGYSTYRGT